MTHQDPAIPALPDSFGRTEAEAMMDDYGFSKHSECRALVLATYDRGYAAGRAAGRAAGVQGEAVAWVLTSEYNDYDQHGAYFRRAWSLKPDREEVRAEVISERGDCSDSLLDHILSGGGRMDGEHVWFNLEKQS